MHPAEHETDSTQAAPRLRTALELIRFARRYTLDLLGSIETDDWYRVPEGCPTHVAWQVGHLAMAEYMLTLFRLRGRVDADAELIPRAFLKTFAKGTRPLADAAFRPSPQQLLQVLHRVHEQALTELQSLCDEDLHSPVIEPYAVEPTVLGSLLFCSQHEMLHAGQIGLIRRLLGYAPR